MLAPIIAGASCVACALTWWRGRLERARLRLALDAVVAERAALHRLAGLAGRDLRDTALRLHAHAGPARSHPDPARGGALAVIPARGSALAVIAERCRALADDLAAAGLSGSAGPPSLRDETLDLLACVREAAQAVAAVIAPGQRQIQVPAGPALIRGDRRALRQVLGRVLTEAALNTRDGDWISLSLTEAPDGGLVLVIADEGLGLAGAEVGHGVADPQLAGRDSRGIAAPLLLARRLMEAHGGALERLATPGAGTEVSLRFPPGRRRTAMAAAGGMVAQTHGAPQPS